MGSEMCIGDSSRIMPEGGMGPALAIPGASSLEDVAELKGGLVRTKEGAYRSGRIRFGGGGDTSALVLTAMKSNPQARGALDLLPEALPSLRPLHNSTAADHDAGPLSTPGSACKCRSTNGCSGKTAIAVCEAVAGRCRSRMC